MPHTTTAVQSRSTAAANDSHQRALHYDARPAAKGVVWWAAAVSVILYCGSLDLRGKWHDCITQTGLPSTVYDDVDNMFTSPCTPYDTKGMATADRTPKEAAMIPLYDHDFTTMDAVHLDPAAPSDVQH